MTFEVKVTDGLGLTTTVTVAVDQSPAGLARDRLGDERLRDALERATSEVLRRDVLQWEFECNQLRRGSPE